MKTLTKAAAGIAAMVLAISLSGCGEDAIPVGAGENTASQSRSSSPSETPAPEPLTATASEPSTESDLDAAFLAEAHTRLASIRSQIPDATDDQLLAAGNEACERLATGESGEEMTLIEGEETTGGYYMDSSAIIIAARLTICPIEP